MSPQVLNVHKVPQKQWRKWSYHAKRVFNELFSAMSRNQWTFTHPKAEERPATQWNTTAWNAAWLAADAVDEEPTYKEVVTLKRGKETSRRALKAA
jgi:hypothetical protein